MCLGRNGMYLKFTVLVHFWAQYTPGKCKILQKTKIFPKTTSLGLSNNKSPRSHISHRSLIQLIKIPIFGALNGPKLPPGAGRKGHHKFSHIIGHIHILAYNRTIHHCLGICRSWPYLLHTPYI